MDPATGKVTTESQGFARPDPTRSRDAAWFATRTTADPIGYIL